MTHARIQTQAELAAAKRRVRELTKRLDTAPASEDWPQRLQAWMQAEGLTMRALAEQIGCSWSCVAAWRYPQRNLSRRARRPSPELEARLLVLGCPHPCGEEVQP